MFQTKKTFIKPYMKMSDLIFENPSLLIMMEHFDLDIMVRHKSVMQICDENQINRNIFISIANLYNGFNPPDVEAFRHSDIKPVICFLKNSHWYYLNEIIPETHNYMNKWFAENKGHETRLVERFFNEYLREVKEHLSYEDEIAFPYFKWLANEKGSTGGESPEFSVKEYHEHHTDIETKLADLKNLLLKHIPSKNNRILRRKLLLKLFELEYDLNIHSIIEESILIPLIRKVEKQEANG